MWTYESQSTQYKLGANGPVKSSFLEVKFLFASKVKGGGVCVRVRVRACIHVKIGELIKCGGIL